MQNMLRLQRHLFEFKSEDITRQSNEEKRINDDVVWNGPPYSLQRKECWGENSKLFKRFRILNGWCCIYSELQALPYTDPDVWWDVHLLRYSGLTWTVPWAAWSDLRAGLSLSKRLREITTLQPEVSWPPGAVLCPPLSHWDAFWWLSHPAAQISFVLISTFLSYIKKKYKTDTCFTSCLSTRWNSCFHSTSRIQNGICKQYWKIMRYRIWILSDILLEKQCIFLYICTVCSEPLNILAIKSLTNWSCPTHNTVWMPAFLTSIKHDKISIGTKCSNRQNQSSLQSVRVIPTSGYPWLLWAHVALRHCTHSSTEHCCIQSDVGKPLHSVHCVSWQSVVNPDQFPQGHFLLSELSGSLYAKLKVIFV